MAINTQKIQQHKYRLLGMANENKGTAAEFTQQKFIFCPTTPLEFGLKLLASVDIRECVEDLSDLRRFVFDFEHKASFAVNQVVEQCGVKCEYDAWMPLLCNAYDINNLLRCLSFFSSVVHVCSAKRKLRAMLINIWVTLDFKGVNESFLKWESRTALRQRASVRAGIIEATLEARRMGITDEQILNSVKNIIGDLETAETK